MYYLLTGAGFSKNWGVPLSRELWQQILGHSEIQKNEELKNLMLDNENNGFERVLADAKQQYENDPSKKENYFTLQKVILENFEDIDSQLKQPSSVSLSRLEGFFAKFDAWFTTNQDMLVERQFGNISLGINNRSRSLIMPGIKSKNPNAYKGTLFQGDLIRSSFDNRIQYPDLQNIEEIDCNTIPYIKLHGSFNWRLSEGPSEELMIMGGNKQEQIEKVPLIKRYFEIFREKLCVPGSKLLILGHSLLDSHINEIIFNSIEKYNLRFYVWNPSGFEGLRKNLKSLNQYDDALFKKGMITENNKFIQELLKDEILMESEISRIDKHFFTK